MHAWAGWLPAMHTSGLRGALDCSRGRQALALGGRQGCWLRQALAAASIRKRRRCRGAGAASRCIRGSRSRQGQQVVAWCSCWWAEGLWAAPQPHSSGPLASRGLCEAPLPSPGPRRSEGGSETCKGTLMALRVSQPTEQLGEVQRRRAGRVGAAPEAACLVGRLGGKECRLPLQDLCQHPCPLDHDCITPPLRIHRRCRTCGQASAPGYNAWPGALPPTLLLMSKTRNAPLPLVVLLRGAHQYDASQNKGPMIAHGTEARAGASSSIWGATAAAHGERRRRQGASQAPAGACAAALTTHLRDGRQQVVWRPCEAALCAGRMLGEVPLSKTPLPRSLSLSHASWRHSMAGWAPPLPAGPGPAAPPLPAGAPPFQQPPPYYDQHAQPYNGVQAQQQQQFGEAPPPGGFQAPPQQPQSKRKKRGKRGGGSSARGAGLEPRQRGTKRERQQQSLGFFGQVPNLQDMRRENRRRAQQHFGGGGGGAPPGPAHFQQAPLQHKGTWPWPVLVWPLCLQPLPAAPSGRSSMPLPRRPRNHTGPGGRPRRSRGGSKSSKAPRLLASTPHPRPLTPAGECLPVAAAPCTAPLPLL